MILSDRTITASIFSLVDIPKSENVDRDALLKQINPNSLDLTIGGTFMIPKHNMTRWVYGFRSERQHEHYAEECWHTCKASSGFILMEPGSVILASTREYITMSDNICGQIFTKSTLGRLFINHMMAGVIDAGFCGRLTLELKNEGQHYIRIPVGARVVQMVFQKLDRKAEAPYGKRRSRYQNAETVECAKPEVTE